MSRAPRATTSDYQRRSQDPIDLTLFPHFPKRTDRHVEPEKYS